jgi:hypothetical protein
LFTPERLDLVVKYRFFRSLEHGFNRAAAEDCYRQHISKRTDGVEPADYEGVPSLKKNLEDYVFSCEKLLSSMSRDGFKSGTSVPVSKYGNYLLNGAHRVACAASLGELVHVELIPLSAGRWDMTWFEMHGFSRDDRLQILHDLVDVAPERCIPFVLWAPAEQ